MFYNISFQFLEICLKSFKNETPYISACGTPEYTNYTGDFKGCLDYIFYRKLNISLEGFVPVPVEKVLSEYVALPSEVFPSDHVALIAYWRWK